MDGRLRALAIRSTFLFLLSLVLVAGFWYHREFYQIGFTNLLIIGGFVTLKCASLAPSSAARRRVVFRSMRAVSARAVAVLSFDPSALRFRGELTILSTMASGNRRRT